MFNFTTETILNDLSKVTVLLGATTAPATAVPWDPGIEATKQALWIQKLNKFLVGGTNESIRNSTIYKRAATAATQAIGTITIPTVVSGTLYRLGVQITVNGYADGMFARDRVLYGKPFYVEYVATATTASTLATALKNAWNAAFATYQNFPVATTSTADLLLTSVNNPYISFKSIILESIDTTTAGAIGNATTVATGSQTTAPVAPFGNWDDITKNHRLPTLENYRPYGLNQDELPVVGATYDQYTFEYVANREDMDTSVVGGTAQSKTTHVIWVNTAAADVTRHLQGTTSGDAAKTAAYGFEDILAAAGITLLNAATKASITITAPTEA